MRPRCGLLDQGDCTTPCIGRNRMTNQLQQFKQKRTQESTLRSEKPGFPRDLVDRRDWLPCANSRTDVQQRHGEGTCSSASEDGAPPSDPRCLGPTLHDQWHFLGTSSGQSCEELRRANIPSASHLSGENHQSSAATFSRKLGVGGFLLAPCSLQGGAVDVFATESYR